MDFHWTQVPSLFTKVWTSLIDWLFGDEVVNSSLTVERQLEDLNKSKATAWGQLVDSMATTFWTAWTFEHLSSLKKPVQRTEHSTPEPILCLCDVLKCITQGKMQWQCNVENLFFQRAHCAFAMFWECTIRGKMPDSEMAIKRVASDDTIDFLNLCFPFQMYYGIENLICSICSTMFHWFFLQIPPNSFKKEWGQFLGGKSLLQHLKCLHDFSHNPSSSKPRWPFTFSTHREGVKKW